MDAPNREDYSRSAYLAADDYRMGVLRKGRRVPNVAMEGGREESSQSQLAMDGEQDVLEGEAPMRCPLQLCG